MRATLAILLTLISPAQEYPHIPPDFHNRYVEVPLDHQHPEQGTLQLYYELSSNFSFDQPTVFFIHDAQQIGRGVDRLAKKHQLPSTLNQVLIEHRGRKHSPMKLEKEDGEVDWEKVYHLMASHQVVEDIEAVRPGTSQEPGETPSPLLDRESQIRDARSQPPFGIQGSLGISEVDR